MNLPSASYVSRCGKPSRSWSIFSDKVPSHVARNCGYQQSNKNQSPEINTEDMASVYSDAGDTFASRPSNAAYEDHHDAAPYGLYSNAQRCTDSDSRDFILKRFLPAAQAMAATGAKSSASTSSLPPENRWRPLDSLYGDSQWYEWSLASYSLCFTYHILVFPSHLLLYYLCHCQVMSQLQARTHLKYLMISPGLRTNRVQLRLHV